MESVRNTDPQRLGVIDIRPHYVSQCPFVNHTLICARADSLTFLPVLHLSQNFVSSPFGIFCNCNNMKFKHNCQI